MHSDIYSVCIGILIGMLESKPDNATFNFFKAHKLKLNIAFYKKLDILELQNLGEQKDRKIFGPICKSQVWKWEMWNRC